MWTGIILLKLFYVQVIQHDYYVNRANKQRNAVIPLLPERGPIVDRNGRPLAISVPMTSIYGVPEAMKDLEGELKTIANIVPIEVKDSPDVIKGRPFIWISRKVNQQLAERVRQQNLPGIYFTTESRRFYPNK